MPPFKPGETIETKDPVISVDFDPANPLRPGRHVFQLIVFDDSRNASEPATVEVIVRDTQRPTAVIDAPKEVEAGKSFEISGKRSSDVEPGQIVLYQWTLLDQP